MRMTPQGLRNFAILAVIAAVGISGVVEALPNLDESAGDLTIDLAVILAVAGGSVVLARWLRNRRKPAA
jgi:hypothetical protein